MVGKIKKLIRKFTVSNQEVVKLKEEITLFHKNQSEIAIENYLSNNLYNNKKYLDNKRLNRYEYSVFSQYGEDGIIDEIFGRLNIKTGFFVEFGVQCGLECNSANLLLKDWKGLWIEASDSHYNSVKNIFKNEIETKQLTVINSYVTPENIESLLEKANVPHELDLLSIDIDFNDYYIWEAIKNYKPKVIVIEYNAIFRPNVEYVVQYNEKGNEGIFSSHFGAGLYSFELLAKQKGYSLVACSFAGINAFFVRNDLLNDLFEAPYTAENHYEPPRYFLYCKHGNTRAWGDRRKKMGGMNDI